MCVCMLVLPHCIDIRVYQYAYESKFLSFSFRNIYKEVHDRYYLIWSLAHLLLVYVVICGQLTCMLISIYTVSSTTILISFNFKKIYASNPFSRVVANFSLQEKGTADKNPNLRSK